MGRSSAILERDFGWGRNSVTRAFHKEIGSLEGHAIASQIDKKFLARGGDSDEGAASIATLLRCAQCAVGCLMRFA